MRNVSTEHCRFIRHSRKYRFQMNGQMIAGKKRERSDRRDARDRDLSRGLHTRPRSRMRSNFRFLLAAIVDFFALSTGPRNDSAKMRRDVESRGAPQPRSPSSAGNRACTVSLVVQAANGANLNKAPRAIPRVTLKQPGER